MDKRHVVRKLARLCRPKMEDMSIIAAKYGTGLDLDHRHWVPWSRQCDNKTERGRYD